MNFSIFIISPPLKEPGIRIRTGSNFSRLLESVFFSFDYIAIVVPGVSQRTRSTSEGVKCEAWLSGMEMEIKCHSKLPIKSITKERNESGDSLKVF